MNRKTAIKIIEDALKSYVEVCVNDDYRAEVQNELSEAFKILKTEQKHEIKI
tara:strand:+ start:674 stop:829 length:156 start_codon:yes stop_codon:yes gene_type:complete